VKKKKTLEEAAESRSSDPAWLPEKTTPVEQVKDHFYSYAEPHVGPSEEPRWIITEEAFEALIGKALEMEKWRERALFKRGQRRGKPVKDSNPIR